MEFGMLFFSCANRFSEFKSLSTQQETHNLFWPDENSIEQCFAAHIVQGC